MRSTNMHTQTTNGGRRIQSGEQHLQEYSDSPSVCLHFPQTFLYPPSVDPNGSAPPPKCPWRENIYYPPLLVFLSWQRNNHSAIQGFHLYSDKGYLGNLVPAISHYGESYEAEIKFGSR